MAEVEVKEFPLANIKRIDVIEETESQTQYSITEFAEEADVEAHVSSGEEKELRALNTIKAQNKTEDIVMGYNIKLTSATLVPELFALIDGGTWDATAKKYTAPPTGSPVNRKLFTLKVYTEEKDTSGETVGYVRFTFPHCKGTPINIKMKNGEFFVPEMTIKSRPATGESPVEFEYLETLPA